MIRYIELMAYDLLYKVAMFQIWNARLMQNRALFSQGHSEEAKWVHIN